MPSRSIVHVVWEYLTKQLRAAFRAIRLHWAFEVVLALFGLILYMLLLVIPPGEKLHDPILTAPDESAHYVFNVKFIAEHNRLPLSGKDDADAYQACVAHHIGLAPCVYSYTIYPGPNYVVSALLLKLFHHLGNPIPSYNVSRITSMLSGMIFAVFSYAAVYSLTRRRSVATILVASVLFIPQFLFTNSYTNLDAHSAAISAILGLCLVKFLQSPRRIGWQIALAIALFGLLPVSKYNYFALGLGALVLIAYTFVRERFTKQEVLRFMGFAAVSFLVLASFWYVRNLLLYHDLFGQSYMLQVMSQHAQLGKPYPINLDSLNIAIQRDFFTTLFQSFFFALGLMHFTLNTTSYDMILLLLLSCAGIGAHFTLISPQTNRRLRTEFLLLVGLYALVSICLVLTVLYNSLTYDFQPQGRYMYPILVPTLLLVAYAIKRDKRNMIIAYLMAGGTAYLFIAAIGVVVKAYMPLVF